MNRIATAMWLVLLAGCPSDASVLTPSGEPTITATSAEDTAGPTPITTIGGTFDPTDPSGASQTGGASESTAATADTTSGVGNESGTTSTGTAGSGDPSTTSSSGSGDAGTTGSSTSIGSTGASMGGSTGGSTGGGCNVVPGNYDNCLGPGAMVDTTVCAAPGATTCIVNDIMSPVAGVCSVTDCIDPCDCPASPGGTAVVSCGDITGNPADLFCYLDCSMGATCPAPMTCFADLCIWPGAGAGGTPYGDCFNNPNSICGLTALCLNDGAMPTIGVCGEPCNVVADCPPAPPGGTVACQDVTTDGSNECILDCAGGGACPAGMTCFGGFICAWT